MDVIHAQGSELGSLLGVSGGESPSQRPGALRSIPSSDARLSLPPSSGSIRGRFSGPVDLNRIWFCLWFKMGMQLWCLVCAAAALALLFV